MNPDQPKAPTQPATAAPLAVDQPPILGTWQRMYGLVLGVFCAVVLLLFWLTRAYQ